MPKKILVVDYEPKSLEETIRLIRKAGYAIIKAKDGLAAIEVFNKENPDGVVLAAMLPKMHGFEVCRTLKKTEKGKQTPIIITTGVYKGEKYKRQALTEYGADYFFEKPYDKNQFIDTIQKLMEKPAEAISSEDIDLDSNLESKLEDTLSGLMEVGSDSDVISTDTNLEAKLEDTLAGLMNIEEYEEKVETREEEGFFNPLELSMEEADEEAESGIETEEADFDKDKFDISDIDEKLEDTLSSILEEEESKEIREDTDIERKLSETLSGLELFIKEDETKEEAPSSQEIDATIEFDTLNAIREKEEFIQQKAEEPADAELIIEERIDKEPGEDLLDSKADILERYGQYELIEKIATGGMAELFKARRINVEGFQKIVAIKRILPHLAEDKEFITMFIDEAKLAAQLTHQNIVQIYDLDKVNSSFYIAMEYVKGKNLRNILQKMKKMKKTVPIELALLIMSKVCNALDYAHRRRDFQNRLLNIVHRDVSPQNMLLSYEGEVKLVDFGIAKAATKASQTQAGALKGKILYMSPEQAWGKKVDKRSDIYSVGIVLFEILTGRRLFMGNTEINILEKVRKSIISKPSEYNLNVPQELDRIVIKALAKDPKDRYQNTGDLQHEIENLLYSGKLEPRKYNLSNFMKLLFREEMIEEGEEMEEEIIDYFKEQEIVPVQEAAPVLPVVIPPKREEVAETIEMDTHKDISSKTPAFIKSDKKAVEEAEQAIVEDWEGREVEVDQAVEYSLPEEDSEETEIEDSFEDDIPESLRKKSSMPPLPIVIVIAAFVLLAILYVLWPQGPSDAAKDGTAKPKHKIITDKQKPEKDKAIKPVISEEKKKKLAEQKEMQQKIAAMAANVENALSNDQVNQAERYLKELKTMAPNYSNLAALEKKFNEQQAAYDQKKKQEKAAEEEAKKAAQMKEQQKIADLLQKADTAFNNSDYEQAILIAQDIIAIDRAHEDALALIDRAKAEQQKLQKQKDQEQRIQTLTAQAKSELQAQKFDQARKTVNQLLAVDPNHKEANNMLIEIELQERRLKKEEEKRLLAQPIHDFEASVPPQLKSKLIIDIRKIKARIPRDFKSQLKKLEERRNRIPIKLLISEKGKVLEAKIILPSSDKNFMDRFGISDEIEKQVKSLRFTPAIKDGKKRRCYINMAIPW